MIGGLARVAAASAAVALLVAPAARAAPGCSGTLTGAVRGRFACTAGLTTAEDGTLVFGITGDGPIAGVPGYVAGSFQLPEDPEVRTYTLESLGMGRSSVAAEGGTLYSATRTTTTRGEVRLTFTRVQKAGSGWVVHGTYRARLVPAASARKDDVVVEVTF